MIERWSPETIRAWRKLLARARGVAPEEIGDEEVLAVLEDNNPGIEALYDSIMKVA